MLFFSLLSVSATRVKLERYDVSDSDYINANHVTLEAHSQQYICCQAPLPNTISGNFSNKLQNNLNQIF